MDMHEPSKKSFGGYLLISLAIVTCAKKLRCQRRYWEKLVKVNKVKIELYLSKNSESM